MTSHTIVQAHYVATVTQSMEGGLVEDDCVVDLTTSQHRSTARTHHKDYPQRDGEVAFAAGALQSTRSAELRRPWIRSACDPRSLMRLRDSLACGELPELRDGLPTIGPCHTIQAKASPSSMPTAALPKCSSSMATR